MLGQVTTIHPSAKPFFPSSVARCAPSTAAVDALYILILLHLRLGNAADARRVEVRLLGLDAP